MRIKTIPLLFMVLVSLQAKAESISEKLAKDPQQLKSIIEEKDYLKKLRFIKEAYAEHQAHPDETVAEFACQMVMGAIPLNQQIALSLDFTLEQPELSMKSQGAQAVRSALIHDSTLDEHTRTRLTDKLKQGLGSLTKAAKNSQEAFRFAQDGLDDLILLGDDAGLDGFLTETQSVRDMSVADHWDVDSAPEIFDQLAIKCAKVAGDPTNRNPDPDKVYAAMYRLAKERRLREIKIEPLHPLVNMDELVPQ